MSEPRTRRDGRGLSPRAMEVRAGWLQALAAAGDDVAQRAAESAGRLWDMTAATRAAVRALLESGRVLNRVNEERLRRALEEIATVLSALEPIDEAQSYRELEDVVSRALKVRYGVTTRLIELYPDEVIFELPPLGDHGIDAATRTYRQGYEVEGVDHVQLLAEPVEVRRVVTWEPARPELEQVAEGATCEVVGESAGKAVGQSVEVALEESDGTAEVIEGETMTEAAPGWSAEEVAAIAEMLERL